MVLLFVDEEMLKEKKEEGKGNVDFLFRELLQTQFLYTVQLLITHFMAGLPCCIPPIKSD